MSDHDITLHYASLQEDCQPCQHWTGSVIGWARGIMLAAQAEDAAARYDKQIADHVRGWTIEHNGVAWIARHPDGLVTLRLPTSVAKMLTEGE